MNMCNNFPSPAELKTELPLQSAERAFIEESRSIARKIVSGDSGRLAVIAGPCSIHETEAALAYARQLIHLSEQVEETLFLVMRVHVEKPRTETGWKGLIYDPHLDGTHAIEEGLRLSRKLFLELAKMRVPASMEFVDPLTALYLDDLVTWGFIGARTSYSQPHRQLASSLPFPVGFKNGIDGDIDQTIHSLISAASSHTFLYIDENGKLSPKESLGNLSAHLVLRGSSNATNYAASSVKTSCEKLSARNLTPRLLIDCAHGNCEKEYEKQKIVFSEVMNQIRSGNQQIMGVMLESHLYAGNQSILTEGSPLKYGVSITDPCLDWLSTEELILSLH